MHKPDIIINKTGGRQEEGSAPPPNDSSRRLADFLDDAFTIPGTGIRFGWDGIIGLIPGVGDVVTLLLSLYIIQQAMMLGAPASVLLRMGMNVAVDSLVGGLPLIGDIADFGGKSNRRNMRLLDEYLVSPTQVQRRSKAVVASVILLVGLVAFAITYVIFRLVAAFIGYIATLV